MASLVGEREGMKVSSYVRDRDVGPGKYQIDHIVETGIPKGGVHRGAVYTGSGWVNSEAAFNLGATSAQ